VRAYRIRHFITWDDPASVNFERLGPECLAVTARVIETLKRGATLLIEDGLGWTHYRANQAWAK